MIKVNLLPGLEQRRERRQYVQLVTTACLLFTFGLTGLGGYGGYIFLENRALEQEITGIESELSTLETQINSFRTVLQQTSLLRNQIRAIQTILAEQNQWSDFFIALAEATPSSGVQYVNLTVDENGKLILAGIADSSEELALLTESLESAFRAQTYEPQTNDSLRRLANRNDLTEETLLQANNVENEEALLALEAIALPQLIFEEVRLVQAIVSSDEATFREVEKDVEFTYEIQLSEAALLADSDL